MVGTIAIAMAKARPFEIHPSKSPDFKWLDFRSPLLVLVRNLNSWMNEMAIIQILFIWVSGDPVFLYLEYINTS